MFGGLDEVFAPARRHTEEERRRQEITLDEVGDSDPGRGPIDLASGSVVIRVLQAADAAEGGAGANADAGDGEGEGEGEGQDSTRQDGGGDDGRTG
ncbi:DUF6191 domain-containing protein [Streptomyces sp. NPDC006704]|uniref:DUF6191 domain-containing protein n=1 Tax=Streptomyces sp. NPDC006704 TaxID=3364760 RepID=UPI0036D0B79E